MLYVNSGSVSISYNKNNNDNWVALSFLLVRPLCPNYTDNNKHKLFEGG